MVRRLTSVALGILVTCMATAAFAQGEGGDAPADDSASAAPAGGDAAPAGDTAAPADNSSGGGDAASSGDKSGGDTGASAAASASTEGAQSGGKIKLGLRLGYALPMGDFAKGEKMSDGISGMIPIWIDAGYMVTPNILVGLYGQYGIVMVKNCPKGASCSGSDMRFGIQGQYHIMPAQTVDPWVGLGIGYELASSKESAGGADVTASYNGFEFANIQAGADFKAGPLTVGPFLSFSLGQYSSATLEAPGVPKVSGSINQTAIHEWLTFGVKGTFGF